MARASLVHRCRCGGRPWVAAALLLLAAQACGRDAVGERSPVGEGTREPVEAPTTRAEQPEEAPDAQLVVFLGDSLTAGYGLPVESAFPTVIGGLLEEKGYRLKVVNAGVSGDTSAGGLRRLDWLLQRRPDVVVVGLGGNDGLRGQSPEMTEENLRRIVERSRQAGARVLLLGMQIPTNYGALYGEQFAAIYPRLAEQLDVPLVPFLLDGVGGVADLNLPDGIHPTPEGHRIVAQNVLPYLEPLLRRRP